MKLEDIPKKQIFETPEGYFDRLPGVIQSRIAEKKSEPSGSFYFRVAVRYALPLIAMGVALFLILRNPDRTQTPEELLASISTEELTDYLVESELSTDDLLEQIDLNDIDVSELNDEIMPYSDLDYDLLEEFSTDLPDEL